MGSMRDRAAVREYNKRYYEAHRAEIRNRQAKYNEENRASISEYNKQYQSEHSDELNARRRSLQDVNRERYRDKRRTYYMEHRQSILEKQAERRAERCANEARRRAAKHAASAGDPSRIVLLYKQAREQKRICCYICGAEIPIGERHVDHIVPLSRGGAHAASNMAIACSECNLRKHTRGPNEIGMLL